MRAFRLEGVYEGREDTFFEAHGEDSAPTKLFKDAFRQFGKNSSKTVYDDDFAFDKIFGWHFGDGDVKGIRAYTERELSYTDRGRNAFELVPSGYTKATGMQAVLDRLGIAPRTASPSATAPTTSPCSNSARTASPWAEAPFCTTWPPSSRKQSRKTGSPLQ
jgi:hypothetical protein